VLACRKEEECGNRPIERVETSRGAGGDPGKVLLKRNAIGLATAIKKKTEESEAEDQKKTPRLKKYSWSVSGCGL